MLTVIVIALPVLNYIELCTCPFLNR